MTCDLKVYNAAADVAEAYQKSVTRLAEIHAEIQEINETLSQVFDGQRFNFCLKSDSYDRGVGAILRNTKRQAWAALIPKMGVEPYMSVAEREKFREAIGYQSKWDEDANDPINHFPEATPENIEAVFNGYAASVDTMLAEKAIEVYKFLKPYASDEYKTNVQNRWKIGDKVILSYAVEKGWGSNPFRISHSKDAKLHSMDVLFHLLDGKGIPHSHRGPLHEAVASIHEAGGQAETEYFRIRVFKNGNLHIVFKRLDLVQDINLMCGNKSELPDQRKEAKFQGQSDEINTDKFANLDLNFFETPPAIVDRLINAVDLKGSDSVLEPSAGQGAIADAVAKHVGHGIHVVEIAPERAEVLHRQGHNVLVSDFLSVNPRPVYDVVLMNPPFSHQRDITHIEHAIKFLSEGGRLAAVASAGVLFRGDKRSVAFREHIARLGGTIEQLPEGSFSGSGTDVNTVIVVI